MSVERLLPSQSPKFSNAVRAHSASDKDIDSPSFVADFIRFLKSSKYPSISSLLEMVTIFLFLVLFTTSFFLLQASNVITPAAAMSNIASAATILDFFYHNLKF